MPRILILFAHPALEKSRVQYKMARQIRRLQNITFHDLYQVYPDLDIDVEQEKKLLLQHDIIIFQHPFYWYSAPAILKQWQDLVLEHGWAYGSGGRALAGKKIFNAITCGGPRAVYQKEGRNRFTINELLAPFNQTAFLCHMTYMPPFVVFDTLKLTDADIELHALKYEELLLAIQSDRITDVEWQQSDYLNDVVPITKLLQS